MMMETTKTITIKTKDFSTDFEIEGSEIKVSQWLMDYDGKSIDFAQGMGSVTLTKEMLQELILEMK